MIKLISKFLLSLVFWATIFYCGMIYKQNKTEGLLLTYETVIIQQQAEISVLRQTLKHKNFEIEDKTDLLCFMVRKFTPDNKYHYRAWPFRDIDSLAMSQAVLWHNNRTRRKKRS